MTKFTTVSAAVAGALMLAACGSGTEATNTTENTALVNFDAPVEDNALLENGLEPVDANAAVESNSLDNAAAEGGNAL